MAWVMFSNSTASGPSTESVHRPAEFLGSDQSDASGRGSDESWLAGVLPEPVRLSMQTALAVQSHVTRVVIHRLTPRFGPHSLGRALLNGPPG